MILNKSNESLLKGCLLDYLQTYHEKAKERGKWNCACGSHDALQLNEGETTWYCYSCGKGGDIIALYAKDHGLNHKDKADFVRCVTELAGLYGIDLPTDAAPSAASAPTTKAKPKAKPAPGHAQEFAQEMETQAFCGAAAHDLASDQKGIAQEARDFLAKRGIEPATWERFGLGVAVDKCGQVRLVIPSADRTHCNMRLCNDKVQTIDGFSKYMRKGKAKVFEALQDGQEHQQPCWIVEGELDALSIWQAGGCAIATSSANITRLAIDYAQANRARFAHFVLFYDVDKAGQEGAKTIAEALQKAGIECYTFQRIEGDTRDANAILQADIENGTGELVGMVRQAQSWSELSVRAIQQLQRLNGADAFERAIRDIHAGKYAQSIATPFGWLNSELYGGLHPGLVVLGATTGAGKTTYALQMVTHIADYGRRVLYISLEMSAVELYTRMISSRLASLRRYPNYPQLTALELRQKPELWDDSPELRDTMLKVHQNIAPRFNIVEGIGNFSALQVAELANYYAIQDKQPPVVVVDYLQMLAPMDARQTDKQATDASIRTLKRLSRDLNTVVIAISSYNRSSYSGDASLSAFKESGGIEYTSDLVLALEAPQDAEQDGGDTRQITLTCLKNRNGRRFKLPYEYHPAYNYFKELNPEKLPRMQPENAPRRAGRTL